MQRFDNLFHTPEEQAHCDFCEKQKVASNTALTYLNILGFSLAAGILIFLFLRKATKWMHKQFQPTRPILDKLLLTNRNQEKDTEKSPRVKDTQKKPSLVNKTVLSASDYRDEAMKREDDEFLRPTKDAGLAITSEEVPKIKIKTRKNSKGEYVPTTGHDTSPRKRAGSDPKVEPSEIKETPAPRCYAINKAGKQIGTLFIEPKLLGALDKLQKTNLKQLCSRGLVLEGRTEHRKGLIYKDKKYKLKDCTKDYRFWAFQVEGEHHNHFIVNGFQPSHKDKHVLRF